MTRALEMFVAEGSAGFTTDPDQAMKSRNGNPIACPGGLNQVWKRHFEQDRAKSEAIWELLFDAYDTLCEAESEQDKRWYGELCRTYTTVLAILKYGVASEEAKVKIKQHLLDSHEEE